MNPYDNAFEIHVHGDVKLRPGVSLNAIEEALRPLWDYAGARSLAAGAGSLYDEEPGLRYDTATRTLHMCWTVEGNEDFRTRWRTCFPSPTAAQKYHRLRPAPPLYRQ